MPWQQMVVDVGLEVDPVTGRMAYREVIFSVPRQSGKTTVVLPVAVERCTIWPDPQRIIYTAQTGSDARKKLLEDQVPILERSKLNGLVAHVHRAQGNEGILFRSGSRISLAASSKDAGHGFTVDLGILDEFWADDDDRREQAILPAMSTRPDAQLLLCSTMGTEASTYLNRKVEKGRAAAVEDRGSGIAYFEWSIPLEADIEDPAIWWEYMPALGWTISESAISHAFQTMEEAEWRRAYGNQATKATHDRIIPTALWTAVTQQPGPSGSLVDRRKKLSFAVDVLPDRGKAAIAVSDGYTVELVDHHPGTGWVVERLKLLLAGVNAEIVIDGGGPAVSVADDLERAGVPVRRMKSAEVIAACSRIHDAIADSSIRIGQSEPLDTAVEGLARKPVGDRFVWSRAASLTDITPFVAATLAYEAAQAATPDVAFIAFD